MDKIKLCPDCRRYWLSRHINTCVCGYVLEIPLPKSIKIPKPIATKTAYKINNLKFHFKRKDHDDTWRYSHYEYIGLMGHDITLIEFTEQIKQLPVEFQNAFL